MADSNNHLAGRLPAEPNPQLRQLDRLVGEWRVTGSFLQGTVSFEWMEGGFFLIQHVDGHAGGRAIRGVEYIGFDQDTQTLRSHYMDIHGSNFTYTWEVDGEALRIWFGDKGSDNFYLGRFSDDGRSFSGSWQWPGGGYSATMTRTKQGLADFRINNPRALGPDRFPRATCGASCATAAWHWTASSTRQAPGRLRGTWTRLRPRRCSPPARPSRTARRGGASKAPAGRGPTDRQAVAAQAADTWPERLGEDHGHCWWRVAPAGWPADGAGGAGAMSGNAASAAPAWANKLMLGLIRLGLAVGASRELRVRGRASGQWRVTPVALLESGGARYLVTVRGHTQWSKNLRAAGHCELRLGRRSERFTATELADGDKPPVIRAYLRKWKSVEASAEILGASGRAAPLTT